MVYSFSATCLTSIVGNRDGLKTWALVWWCHRIDIEFIKFRPGNSVCMCKPPILLALTLLIAWLGQRWLHNTCYLISHIMLWWRILTVFFADLSKKFPVSLAKCFSAYEWWMSWMFTNVYLPLLFPLPRIIWWNYFCYYYKQLVLYSPEVIVITSSR